jgi:hypothetical protein
VNRTTASGADARRLAEIAGGAAECNRCDLYRRATQTVFGEGPVPAALMLVGEQPGDQEDKQGVPFVGPAGRVLDDALEAAGIDRGAVYVTNAVKHFKWEARGRRRRLVSVMAVVVLLSGLAAGSASAAPAQSQPAGDDRLDVYIAKLDLRQLEQVRASGVDPH